MKRNIFILIGCLFLMAPALKGQDYYYSDNRKIHFDKAEHWVVVQVAEKDRLGFEQTLEQISAFHVKQALKPGRGIFWIETAEKIPIQTTLSQLRLKVEILRTIPVYFSANEKGDTTRFIMSDEFRVKFLSHVTITEIEMMNEKYGVDILNANKYDEYTLRVTEQSTFNTLELANLYYESDLTIWSLPDFLADIRMEEINDPLFPNQWHLRNTGQGGGTSGVDINTDPAWNITTGCSDIIIAVVDGGAEEHEDFHTGQLISGYTARIGGDGSSSSENTSWAAHGQCVAGIASAAFNTIGVRGVTNNVTIMPIRIGDVGASFSDIAAAIDTAWTRGAHVLNNSWGVQSPGFYNDDVAEAIYRALTEGRDGKGSLVVKSAGNTGHLENYVTFPGTVPGVLVVGAVTNQNNPAYYTPRDPRVDVVTPSNGGTLGITTMDRMGSKGYSSGNYDNGFGGTSAAAPQASGIGALILSLNPELDARPVGPNPNPQVQNAIKLSADDYGSTEWDGYGRINAYKALKYVLEHYGGTLTSSFTIPSGETWTFQSGVSVNLNGYNITSSGGTINIESGATFTPDIRLKSGSTVLGLYTSLDAAYADGSDVEIRGTHTFTDYYTVSTGRTLRAESGSELKFPSWTG